MPIEHVDRLRQQHDDLSSMMSINAALRYSIKEVNLNVPYPSYISDMTLNDIRSSINMCDVQQASLNSMINACCTNTEHFCANGCEYFVRSEPRYNRYEHEPLPPDEEDNIDEGPVGLTIINCEEEDKTEKSTSSRARFVIIFIAGMILGVALAVIDYIINGGIL